MVGLNLPWDNLKFMLMNYKYRYSDCCLEYSMQKMYPINITDDMKSVVESLDLVLSAFSFIFCILATIVLVYFIRRRYGLCNEIRQITQQQLWDPSYQSHLKNLQVKLLISNFIILILLVEIANNSSTSIRYFKGFLYESYKKQNAALDILIAVISYSTRVCYTPLLCIIMRVLWHIYLYLPYKHTVLRWTAYIALRVSTCLGLCLIYFGLNYDVTGFPDETLSWGWIETTYPVFQCVELGFYLLYSRKFYLLLQARRNEARISSDDRNFLEYKYLCLHFKIATILVAVALIISTTANFGYSISRLCEFSYEYAFKLHNTKFTEYTIRAIQQTFRLQYRVLLNLDYVYVFGVILFKYCSKKQKLN